ncbi:MAG: hypothetical protein ACMUJI_04910 [Erythrobacter sp.]|jgi:hypothetical protein|nr:hypothetical protein [Erythrobacter aurantius]
MYSFFELSGTTGARIAAAAGSLIITITLMATAIVPASPAATFTLGAIA